MVFLLVTVSLPSGLARAFVPRPQEIPPSYQPAAENERFALYVDASTLAFKLLDKRSGYLWHSGIDELQPGRPAEQIVAGVCPERCEHRMLG